MAKKLAAILLCVVLIFVGVLALGHLTRPLGDDVAIANVENFHKLPENSIDVIVYGSSHAWRNVNADEMYDKYGIGAYNYAANWQHLDTTWLFVHDSLATQTPKVALIEGMHINSNVFDTDMDGEIYYTTPIPASKYKRAYLKMCFENHIERYISYYFPLVAYHENKNALTAESFGRTSNSIDFMDTMGFYPRDGVFVADVKDWTEMENWVIGDRSLELKKAARWCSGWPPGPPRSTSISTCCRNIARSTTAATSTCLSTWRTPASAPRRISATRTT